MKKLILLSCLMLSSNAQAATLIAGQNYNMNILADGVSCFAAGDCSSSSSYALSDNNSDDDVKNMADADTRANYALGSSIAGDGYAGVINISTTDDGAGGVNFTVNTFNMDTYLNTYGGSIAVWAEDVSAMTGNVDASGNISLDLTGRLVSHQFLQVLGGLSMNVDNSYAGKTELFTTGVSNNFDSITGDVNLSLSGSVLQDDLSAVLVSAGNFGNDWAFFSGTPYTEVYSVQFEQVGAVPVPAALWLFGSGLLALMGFVKRR